MNIINNYKLQKVTEIIEEALDNQPAGFIYDYQLVQSTIESNGVWVRIIKLDENHVSYSEQSDSMDIDPDIGSIEDAAEKVVNYESN